MARSIGRLTAVARMVLRDEYAAQDAVQEMLGAPNTTTLATDSTGQTTKSVGIGPTWDDVEQFLRAHLG